MAINFPSSPADGTIFVPIAGTPFIYRNSVWKRPPIRTALPKNYFLNPCMQVVQQYPYGTALPSASGIVSAIAYPCDQWMVSWAVSPATYYTQIATGSSGRGTHSVLHLALVAAGAVPAGGYLQIQQAIEGIAIAEFQWGTTSGKYAVFSFGFYTNIAGNYSVQIKNAGASWTYTALFNAPANAWTTVTVPIPPPPVGSVWNKQYNLGMSVGIGLAAGSPYNDGLAGGWNNSNKVTAVGATMLSAAGGMCFFADAGFYMDPYQTGVAPPFEYPEYSNELRRCRRYWNRIYGSRGSSYTGGSAGSMTAPLGCYMLTNTAPVVSEVAVNGTIKIYDGTNTPSVASILTNGHYSNYATFAADYSLTSALTVPRPALQYYTSDADYFAINRRMM
jgi:hypothetical protein